MEGPPGPALTSLLYGNGADGAAAEDAATAWFESVLAELEGGAAPGSEPPS